MNSNVPTWLVTAILLIAAAVAVYAGLALVLVLLWNALLVPILHVEHASFVQVLVVVIFLRLAKAVLWGRAKE